MRGKVPVCRAVPFLALLVLGACRSVDPGLGLTSAATADPSAASVAAEPAGTTREPVQFLPVVGIPADRAPALSAALAAAAADAGVPILPAAGGVAAQRLKGYLSVVRDTDGASVVYVWDIVDPSGDRLDRIQGQVRATGSAESWAGVDDQTLAMVARETLAAYLAHARVASGPGG